MFRILLLPLAMLFLSNCSTSKASKNGTDSNADIVSIQWGKSFGMCRGYCLEEYTFTKDSVFKHRQSWQPEVYPDKDTSWSETAGFDIFADYVEFDSLQALGERIGCPDCADGGSEWLAIRLTDGRYHKVVFEFGSSPDSQAMLLMHIREWYDKQRSR